MKKYCISLSGALLFSTLLPFISFAEPIQTPIAVNETLSSSEAERLYERLQLIKSQNNSDLTSVEKATLKAEVLTIKQKMVNAGGGIYISLGAALVIILLLLITVVRDKF